MSLSRLGQPGWGTSPSNPPPNPLMWTCSIEVFNVFLDHRIDRRVPDNQGLIEAFPPHAPDESPGARDVLWSAVGGVKDPNAARLRDLCESDED
jgi:hypothetical protein